MEHQFSVPPNEAGERLDKWLTQKLPQYSRKQIKTLLDGGRVLINRRRVLIAGWEIEPDDSVEVRVPPGFTERADEPESQSAPAEGGRSPQREEGARPHHHDAVRVSASIDRFIERRKKRPQPPPIADAKPSRGPRREGRQEGRREGSQEGRQEGRRGGKDWLHVYHEDRDVIVVEKPAGILSMPAGKEKRDRRENLLGQVQRYVRRRFPEAKSSFVSPLHRLDTETSGIMVFALSNAGKHLEQQFRQHSIDREYIAVVSGRLEREQGVIDKPIEKGRFHGGRKGRAAPEGEGRRAVTEWRVKERYADATMLVVRVRTGRTHQIRIHLAGEGHPIIGDQVYADKSRPMRFKRHALHAHRIGFTHPNGGKKLLFESKLPDDLAELIDGLREGKSM